MERVETKVRKEHIKRMEPTKLTKPNVGFMKLEGQEEIMKWIFPIKQDIDAAIILQADFTDRKPFR